MPFDGATAAFPVARAFVPLLQPARYKGAYGGRSGAKSHFFADYVIARCLKARTRVVCLREVQATLKDSVRQLIIDKLIARGVLHMFTVLVDEIRGPNGSIIILRGMQAFNADNLKSLEDFDIAWIEEAQTISARSLRILRPTIRKNGSEILASWNPRHDTDPIDVFLRQNPPDNAIVIPVGYADNPWLPDVVRDEIRHDFATDPEMAEHVWNGGYEFISEAAYYAAAIKTAEQSGRVGFFPHKPGVRVHTAWDIGVADYTAIWFIQENGRSVDVIDYWETENEGAEQIVDQALPEYRADVASAAAQLIEIDRPRPFLYGNHYLPHDVRVREWGRGARSRVEALLGLGLRNIVKGSASSHEDQVAAVRAVLPLCRFNQTPRVMQGLRRLRRYRRGWNKLLGVYTGPQHDDNSHGASAFATYAFNCPLTEMPQADDKGAAPPPGSVPLPGPPEPETGTRISV